VSGRGDQSEGVIAVPAFLSKVVHPPRVGDRTAIAWGDGSP